MQFSRWLLRVCLWLLCIIEVWAATFKLALVGPWSCDPLFSRAMPTAAANLALSRLQSDSAMSRGYWYDVKLLDEDCSASKGLLDQIVTLSVVELSQLLVNVIDCLVHIDSVVSFDDMASICKQSLFLVSFYIRYLLCLNFSLVLFQFRFDLCGFISALTKLRDMKGYGHAYIGPFSPALCHAVSLLTRHWEAGLASPGCLDADWLNLPPITPPSSVLFTVLRFFRWAHVSIISGKEVMSLLGVVWCCDVSFVCCQCLVFLIVVEMLQTAKSNFQDSCSCAVSL